MCNVYVIIMDSGIHKDITRPYHHYHHRIHIPSSQLKFCIIFIIFASSFVPRESDHDHHNHHLGRVEGEPGLNGLTNQQVLSSCCADPAGFSSLWLWFTKRIIIITAASYVMMPSRFSYIYYVGTNESSYSIQKT